MFENIAVGGIDGATKNIVYVTYTVNMFENIAVGGMDSVQDCLSAFIFADAQTARNISKFQFFVSCFSSSLSSPPHYHIITIIIHH